MAELKMTPFEALLCYEFIKDKLETHVEFARCSSVDIELSYNGVGSNEMPAIIRRKLTKYSPHAIEAIANHDLEWHLVEQGRIAKSREEFLESNVRLKHNIRTCAAIRLSKWSFEYWFYHAGAWCAEQACNRFGWDAWSS